MSHRARSLSALLLVAALALPATALVPVPDAALDRPLPAELDPALGASAVREAVSGGSLRDWYNSASSDGNAVFVGGYSEKAPGDFDLVIARYTLQDQLVWQKTWGGALLDRTHRVLVAGDHVYLTGITGPSSSSDIVIQKYDKDGNLVWSTTWGGLGLDWGSGLGVDGGFVYVNGRTTSKGAGNFDAVTLKLDAGSGALVWESLQGNAFENALHDLVVRDGFVYGTGWWRSGSAGSTEDGYYSKLDADDGSVVWQKTLGGASFDRLLNIHDLGGDLVLAGRTMSQGAGGLDAWVSRIDTEGAVAWERTLGGALDDGFHGDFVANGRIYLSGWTYSFGAGNMDWLLAAYSPSGELLYRETWGGAKYDEGFWITVVGSNIYYAGRTDSVNPTSDFAVVQFKECSPNGAASLAPDDAATAPKWAQDCAARLAARAQGLTPPLPG